MIKNLLIIILSALVYFAYIEESNSLENNQYCNIQTTTTQTVDKKGKVTKIESEEKVICDDKQKHFYEKTGLANSCNFFNWYLPVGSQKIKKRSIVCKTSEGNYEVLQNFNSID
tara:strand:- start:335 stop:676 length:342 start_codon:yes stop_codon:yes gene_type:complete